MTSQYFHTIVIGGGPAGMMAAIKAAENGQSVAIIEGNETLGKKLSITGNGRCNVTNLSDRDAFLKSVVNHPKFLLSALSNFSPKDAILFFEQAGVDLVVEDNNRVFPKSNQSISILHAFEKYLIANEVKVFVSTLVQSVQKSEHPFVLTTTQATFACKNLVVATGGLSYPGTGSKGFGLVLAKQFGHNIVLPKPALVQIALKGEMWKQMEGISLKNISLLCKKNDKLHKEIQGDLLFTFHGISGPATLSMSSLINRLEPHEFSLFLNFFPTQTRSEVQAMLMQDLEGNKNKNIENILAKYLPKRLIPVFLNEIGIETTTKPNNFSKPNREKLVSHLTLFPLPFLRLMPIETGIVTSGGVDTTQIDPKTMESKQTSNLFFVGEVLDVDAFTGGYNIQIALSTGYLAGKTCGGNK